MTNKEYIENIKEIQRQTEFLVTLAAASSDELTRKCAERIRSLRYDLRVEELNRHAAQEDQTILDLDRV